MKWTAWRRWAVGCTLVGLHSACSDDSSNVEETPDASVTGQVSETGLLGDAATAPTNDTVIASSATDGTRSGSDSRDPKDAGDDGSESRVVFEAGRDASDGGSCPTESAIALLAEDERDYIVDGDDACVGNRGCTARELDSSCGNGGYHCTLCNDELCVALDYVVECSGPLVEPDASHDGGVVEAGRVVDAQTEAGNVDAQAQ